MHCEYLLTGQLYFFWPTTFWQELGVASLSGTAILLSVIPFPCSTTEQKKLSEKRMKLKDDRINKSNEVMSGIKVVKLTAGRIRSLIA